MLNDAIQLGPFILRYQLLIIIIAGVIAYFLIKARLKRTTEINDEMVINHILNMIFIWVFTWKLSYLFFNFSSVLANPLSILFYSGGMNGGLLGSTACIIYVFILLKKIKLEKKTLFDAIYYGLTHFFIIYFAMIIFLQIDIFINLFRIAVLIVVYLFYVKYGPMKNLEKKEDQEAEGRKQFMKKILAIIIFIGLIGYTVYSSSFTSSNRAVGIEKGNAAPDFELVTLTGETMKLSDFQGKKVMLNFWASWCGPCRAEMPDMEKLQAEFSDELVILAVNAFHTETSEEKPAQFVKEYGLTYPILIDEKGKVNNTYQVIALPTTYFVDSDGIIRDKFTGTLSYQQMLAGIKKLK